MSDVFNALKAPFPPDRISWRVGSTNKDKTKGMALAYIDARDVMERLDEVLGPDGWQCRYPHANGKTVCDIGIMSQHGEWIWKADGAGDTDFEADKGALSDAFKRAAVRWGIGRYLYDMSAPWVEIEAYGNPNKPSYKIKESEMPKLNKLLGLKTAPKKSGVWHGPLSITELKNKMKAFAGDLSACTDAEMLNGLMMKSKPFLEQCERDLPEWYFGDGGDIKGAQSAILAKTESLNKPQFKEAS